MASISITIPDNISTEVLRAYTNSTGYQINITDDQGNSVPNPETRTQYAKRMIAQHVKDVVVQYLLQEAAQAARVTKSTEVNAYNIT